MVEGFSAWLRLGWPHLSRHVHVATSCPACTGSLALVCNLNRTGRQPLCGEWELVADLLRQSFKLLFCSGHASRNQTRASLRGGSVLETRRFYSSGDVMHPLGVKLQDHYLWAYGLCVQPRVPLLSAGSSKFSKVADWSEHRCRCGYTASFQHNLARTGDDWNPPETLSALRFVVPQAKHLAPFRRGRDFCR